MNRQTAVLVLLFTAVIVGTIAAAYYVTIGLTSPEIAGVTIFIGGLIRLALMSRS